MRHDRRNNRPGETPQRRGAKNGEEAIGRSRSGITTQILAIVDELANQLEVKRTSEQVYDVPQAEALAAQLKRGAILSDNGNDADAFIDGPRVRKIAAVMPPNAPPKREFTLDTECSLNQGFFKILINFRATATCFEKTAHNHLTGLYLACALT